MSKRCWHPGRPSSGKWRLCSASLWPQHRLMRRSAFLGLSNWLSGALAPARLSCFLRGSVGGTELGKPFTQPHFVTAVPRCSLLGGNSRCSLLGGNSRQILSYDGRYRKTWWKMAECCGLSHECSGDQKSGSRSPLGLGRKRANVCTCTYTRVVMRTHNFSIHIFCFQFPVVLGRRTIHTKLAHTGWTLHQSISGPHRGLSHYFFVLGFSLVYLCVTFSFFCHARK